MSQTVQVQKRKKGRPKLRDASITFRLPYSDVNFFNAVSAYEGRDRGELMRAHFLKMKKEYRRDPSFHTWVHRHAEELAAQGIQPEEIF